MRGQHVQGLEFTADVTENPLQVLQNAAGELVHQERATGLEDLAGFQQDPFPHRGGNGAEGNSGNDVAGVALPVAAQDLVHGLGGALDDVQPLVLDGIAQVADEVRVGFNGDEHRIGAHASQHLGGDDTNAGAVLHDDPRLPPVHRLEELADEEARARNDRAEHHGMTEKVQREQPSAA